MMKYNYISLITAILMIFAFAGCNGGGGDSPGPADAGEKAEFTIKTYEGETITPGDYLGKVILVDYWATWCAPCRKEFPHFNELLDTYGDDLVIIAITMDDDMKLLENFIEENPLRFIIGMNDGSSIQSWKTPNNIPVAYIIDREGYIRKSLKGGHGYEEFDSIIKPLIDAKAVVVEEAPADAVPDAANEAEPGDVPAEEPAGE